MKYAILGIGQAGLRHYEAFKKIKKIKLVGFTEFDKSKAINFQKKTQIKHYNNLDDILKLSSIIKPYSSTKLPPTSNILAL